MEAPREAAEPGGRWPSITLPRHRPADRGGCAGRSRPCRDRRDRIAGAIQHAVEAAPEIEAYVVALWDALLRPAEAGIRLADLDRGASSKEAPHPGGLAFLVRAAPGPRVAGGRAWLVPEDIRAIFPEIMAHRIFLEPVHELRRAEIVPALCRAVFDTVPAP